MIRGFSPLIKAIPTIVVGIAFLLSGCYPKPVRKELPPKEIEKRRFILAEQEFQSGNFDRAIENYELFLKQNPKGETSRKALDRIARIHYIRHDYDRALSTFKRILKEYPDHIQVPVVRYDIANAYFRLGNYRKSKERISKWLKDYPENPSRGEALFLMGWNEKALEDNSRAMYWWLKALKATPDPSERRDKIHNGIVDLIKASHIKDLKEMAQYAAGTRYTPRIYHKIAFLYLNDNKLQEAKDAALALIKSTREQSWILAGRHILADIDEKLSVKKGVIGCLLPLSGPFAIYGQEALNSIQLGMGLWDMPEDNQEENQGLELIIMDTKGESEAAVSAVEKLATKDRVMAIIGPLASKPALAAAKKAQELGVPIITLTQKEGITAEGEMVFRNFLTPTKQINRLLDKAMNEMLMKRFAILYPDNHYGRFFMNLFWDRVEELGGMITAVESYDMEKADFADEVKKMVGLYYPRPESVIRMLEEKRALEAEEKIEKRFDSEEEEPEPIVDFEAVFIPDNPQRVTLIAPQFPFNNIFHIRFLGTSLWQSPELLETAGNYIQGAIFPSGFSKKSNSDGVKEFIELYKEEFDSEPGILAASGYDTIRFLEYLMSYDAVRTRDDLRRALSRINDFYGITGKISFDHQGEVEKDPILLTVSGKHFRLLP